MKQLLLRVPDAVHRKLSARAARDGRSINAVATEIIDSAIDADEGGRQGRLRARAAALGMLSAVPAEPATAEQRERALAEARGLGPILDRVLDEDRERA